MNVLVCVPCLLTGGTEIQTLSLVKCIVGSGHIVSIACYFEHSPEMVRRFEDAGASVHLLSPTGVRPSGIRATTKFLWKGLKKIISSGKPHVAHVQYMAPGAIPIIILRALGVKKILATSHTAADIYSKNGLRFIRFLSNYILSGFQCITERAERSYFGSSRVFDGRLSRHFTIYNSLPDHISIRSTPRLPYRKGDTLTIGVVSRLEKIKGMDLVIPAFDVVAKNTPDIRLLIVGDGALRPMMEAQAANSEFPDRIEFTGRLPQSELQSQYDRIDILLMPSRSEGFGLTALEGMARGCVPIVANTGGLPEVVRDGIDGFVHNQGSINDIAYKLTNLLDSPELFNLMQSATLSRAEAFSQSKFQRQIDLLYSSLNSRN